MLKLKALTVTLQSRRLRDDSGYYRKPSPPVAHVCLSKCASPRLKVADLAI